MNCPMNEVCNVEKKQLTYDISADEVIVESMDDIINSILSLPPSEYEASFQRFNKNVSSSESCHAVVSSCELSGESPTNRIKNFQSKSSAAAVTENWANAFACNTDVAGTFSIEEFSKVCMNFDLRLLDECIVEGKITINLNIEYELTFN